MVELALGILLLDPGCENCGASGVEVHFDGLATIGSFVRVFSYRLITWPIQESPCDLIQDFGW